MKMITLLIFLAFAALDASHSRADSGNLILAEVASKTIDPSAYLVSEKLDGVRAIWDGKVLRFRSGNTVLAPAWFIGALPKTPLDGELWLGRGQFDELSGIVRTFPPRDQDWLRLSLQVFELPNAPGSFAQRYVRMQEIAATAQFAQLQVVPQRTLQTNAQLQAYLHSVVRAGGEGLMLHLASANYQTGRQNVLLKLKPVLDAEAEVVGYRAGKGKFIGMLGSLELKTDSGVRFRLGTGFKNTDRMNPPQIGARVSYSYQGLTKNGVPRFASFLRVRIDP